MVERATPKSFTADAGPADPPQSVRALCEAIWDLERDLGLLDWELRGIKPWQALRYRVFQQLAQRAGLFGPAAATPPQGATAQLQQLGRQLVSSIAHNPFVGKENIDALVLEPGRSRPVEGRLVNVHTHFLLKELDEEGKRVQIVSFRFNGAHRKGPDPRRAHADAIELATRVRARLRGDLSPREVAEVAVLEGKIRDACGLELALVPLCRSLARTFWPAHDLYRRLLERRRPREVYCICAYGQLAPFVKASRDAGIPVSEVQHGVITRYHLGYSFPVQPSRGRLEYFPDRLLSWGQPWGRWMDLPELSAEIVPFGYRFFEHQQRRYADVATRPGTVVVLSQGVLGPRIARRLLESFEALAHLDIVFKLHPTEYPRWRSYDSMRELARKPNVTMASDVDLYQILAESEYQVGVFSTALYEGLAFGCKTVLLELPGIEYMDAVMEAGDAIHFEEFLHEQRP